MTQTDTFPSETIILVPDALRLILQQKMLKRGSGQIGITLISLSAWRRRFSLTQPPSRASQLLSFRHTLALCSRTLPSSRNAAAFCAS